MVLTLTTLVRVLVAPLVLLVRLLGIVIGLIAALVKLVVLLALVGLLGVFALQAAGMGVDLGPADDVDIPGIEDAEGVDPGDPSTSTYEYENGTVNATEVEREIHEEVNHRRSERGLDPLDWDQTVASVSRAHSKDMADRGYFAHTNPDGEGPFDRYRSVGGGCHAYGENIAMTWVGQPVETEGGDVVSYETDDELAAGLVEQWMNSPGHRENMLSEDWQTGGVGVYVTDEGQIYATHNFCRGWTL